MKAVAALAAWGVKSAIGTALAKMAASGRVAIVGLGAELTLTLLKFVGSKVFSCSC